MPSRSRGRHTILGVLLLGAILVCALGVLVAFRYATRARDPPAPGVRAARDGAAAGRLPAPSEQGHRNGRGALAVSAT